MNNSRSVHVHYTHNKENTHVTTVEVHVIKVHV